MDIKYVECKNCSTIHYIVTEEEAKNIQRSGVLVDEFSDRNLECCIHCGSKNKFLSLSETEALTKLTDAVIPAILIKNV